jgi:hypothetical protein
MAITRVPHKGQTSMPGHLTAAPNLETGVQL